MKQTHVDEVRLESVPKIVKDASLVQDTEICHVLHLVKLGRVHLLYIVRTAHRNGGINEAIDSNI